MKKRMYTFAAVVAVSCSVFGRDPVDWVNTEIGTISHMLVPCFQTTQLPNAMLRVLPPYRDYTDDRVSAIFLQTPDHRGQQVFAVHPFSGDAGRLGARWSGTWDSPHSTPYSYDVTFDSECVKFSIVPARQSALASFEFRRADAVHAVVFTGRDAEVRLDGARIVAKDVRRGRYAASDVWLAGEFSPAPVELRRVNDGFALVFAPEAKSAMLKYGISYIDAEQAARNCAREISGWDMAALAAAGRRAWNEKLSKIEVEGGTDAEKTVFYSSLWRCYERMVNVTEDGRYRGWDGKVHETGGVDQYTDDWMWDTYRAHHPLMVILEPKAEAAKLTSYIRMAAENKEKWMPTFPGINCDQHCMINHHAAISFYDAWVKGVRGFDLAAAFKALDYTEKTESLVPWYRGPLTELDRFYVEKGYMPALNPGDKETCPAVDQNWENRQTVSVTQGSSYDAWAMSKIAAIVGDADGVKEYDRRSKFYRNLWDPKTKFFRPRNAAGEFVEPFDPIICGGKGARSYYTENNAWTYIWDVQHDIPQLVEYLGGPAGMARRLDEMLNTSCGNRFRYTAEMPDGATGMMGMFTMANEPSFHIPYLYNFAGEPRKTQKFVRKTLDAWFRNDRMGMCGDEDGGGMCSYAVFSMMGFYPVTPGLPEYQLGSPVFSKVTIHQENGKSFVVDAPKSSRDAKYVASATIGGSPLVGTAIPHAAVVSGETLRLEMTAE